MNDPGGGPFGQALGAAVKSSSSASAGVAAPLETMSRDANGEPKTEGGEEDANDTSALMTEPLPDCARRRQSNKTEPRITTAGAASVTQPRATQKKRLQYSV
jgi:hypothetical protein